MPETIQYPQEQIKIAWKSFINGQMPESGVRPRILSSWLRCKRKGVDPLLRSAPMVCNKVQLNKLMAQNQRLVKVSSPIINHMYQFIKGAGFTISISDAKGVLLIVSGDDDTVSQAGQGNGVPGANWGEEGIGSNPIGTAIAENRPLQIFGYEHYCLSPHNWAGSGAPIHDSSGKIIGAMSICGVIENVNYHTLGMVVMTTYAIEKQLKILQTLETLNHEYNHKSILVNTISDGVLVVNNENKTIDTNQALCKMLSVVEQDLLDKPIEHFTKDKTLLDAVCGRNILRDYVTSLHINGRKYPCTVTVRPLTGADEYKAILVVCDATRIKKLAKKIDENQAIFTFQEIIGKNLQFLRLIEMGKAIAKTDSSVMLLGESGTGKEVFAQAIHNHSNRKNGPFIAINCGAMPRDLIISELFGYVEGAFTGAKKGGQIGRFELANGGTIFLDEIGELPYDLQATLLRAIEQLVITKVGGHFSIPIDIRILAATNRNLLDEVRAKRFREDLYYRLNVLSIEMLALRQRKDDLPELALHFMERLSSKYAKDIISISDEVWQIFFDYDWPGNIRELKNVVERAVVLAKTPYITVDELPSELLRQSRAAPATALHTAAAAQVAGIFVPPATAAYAAPPGYAAGPGSPPAFYAPAPPQAERQLLQAMLEENRWNVSLVAKQLGVARSTMYRKIHRYGL